MAIHLAFSVSSLFKRSKKNAVHLAIAISSVLFVTQGGRTMPQIDIPASESHDSIMSSPAEVQRIHEWVRSAFLGLPPSNRIALTVRRQDHSVLQFGRSCIDTPLRIGSKMYKHGLGTHAVSEIAVVLPTGAKRFKTEVGVDNNYDTAGSRGSVTFAVSFDGVEAYESDVRKGNNGPLPLDITIPAGAKEMALKVGDAGDGPTCDQADWANARLILADSKTAYLDDNQLDILLSATTVPPFSFTYGGIPSSQLLPTMSRTVSEVSSRLEAKPNAYQTRIDQDALNRRIFLISWKNPLSGLEIVATVSEFKDYPAAEWVLTFTNSGSADTPIIENIQAVDVGLRSGYVKSPLIINQLHGDECSEHSFTPIRTEIDGGKSYSMAPTGGRPSSMTAFPWFNLEYAHQGCITAIGWTGQWAATIDRSGNGPARLRAGMEKTHLLLHPGESIRSPRVLVMPWEGDKQAAHVRFRRLIMFHYAAQLNHKPAWLPLNLQTYDRYNGREGWATEKGQLDYVRAAADLGFDSAWLDAAWFPGEFPNGVGNWYAKPVEFPNGLRPVTDLAHKLNLKYILWFEPERVAKGSQIATEHPQYVIGGTEGGLYKLNDLEARDWLTDLLSKRIDEWNLDVYRNDFNMDPLDYWRASDAPDRQGITEIRYVEGLYKMWDTLLQRHPGLLIDNCASGGRRLDLEMIMRSVPLWRSDTGCSPGHPEWNQMQSMQLAQYLPQFNISCWEPDFNEMRSSATMGVNTEFPYLEPDFAKTKARAVVKEAQRNRWFWYGDFYPLTDATVDPNQFAVFQIHRPDRDAGIVYGFRRKYCRTVGIIVGLSGLRPNSVYNVSTLGEDGKVSLVAKRTGKQLSDELPIKVSRPGASVLIRYEAVK